MPKRLVVLGGGIIGCEFASIMRRFGAEVTIIEMLPSLIPQEDADAAKELAKQFGKRGIDVHLDSRCDKVEDTGNGLRVQYNGDQTVECDLMLVATGRGPLVEGLGLEEIGVELDPRKGIAADEHRRTTQPHIYAVGDCAGYWQLAHTAFREGEVAAENAMGHEAVVDNRGVPRPIYTDPEIAGVGLTEAEAREQHGDDVAVGVFPWVANARAVMQNETVGWVKSIHETRYGELLGLIMVGPHVTDLIEAGVVALDAEATVETVADGMTAHPTLSEGIKEAGLLALGRAIHMPNRKRAATQRVAVSENGRSPFEQHGGIPCGRRSRDPRASLRQLARLRRPADRAFEQLYEQHAREVYQYALALTANPADAEDVTQTTFLNAYRAFQKGERPHKPHNWLITIAHNVCRMRWRSGRLAAA